MIVLVEFVIKAGFAEEFLVRVKQQAAVSLALEPQCTHFDVAVDGANRNRVVLYEIYDDAAAFDLHLASAHFKAFDAEVGPWIESKSVQRLEGPLT